MKILLLITTLTLVECRPQTQEEEAPVSIEFGSFYQSPLLTTTNILGNSQYPNYFYDFAQTSNKNPFRVKNQEEIKISDILNQRSTQIQKLLDIDEAINEMNAKIAPYKNNPLLGYVKDKITIPKEKLIRFRSDFNGKKEDVITLILKPAAKAVAGQEGKAIANPISKAILREGTNVDILFEPEAVAIAGPGGIAHAESDLEINYEET